MGKKKKPNNPQSSSDGNTDPSKNTPAPIPHTSAEQSRPPSDGQENKNPNKNQKQKGGKSGMAGPSQAQIHSQPSTSNPQPSTSNIQPTTNPWNQPRPGAQTSVRGAVEPKTEHQNLPPSEQQDVPMGKKSRNKYPKGGQEAQQQLVSQPPVQQDPILLQQKLEKPKRENEQTLPTQGQQSAPMGKKTRNKYPKGGQQESQQQVPSQAVGSQQEPILVKSIVEKLVISPTPSIDSTPEASTRSSSSNNGTRTSKGGYLPLEVASGSRIGTRGQVVNIEVNYLKIQLERMVPKAYHYDIRFDPEKIPKKFMHDIVEKFREKCFPKHFIAFDGKNNVYSSTTLPIKGNTLKDELVWHDNQTNRDRTIIITLKEVDTLIIDLTEIKKYVDKVPNINKPLRAIQCLEIILRMPVAGKFVNVNRSFFTRPVRQIDLGENYELWTGLYQSVILGDLPLFNVDVVNKPFPTDRTVLNLITDVMQEKPDQPLRQPQLLHDYLKGLNLVYSQPGTSFSNVFKYNGLKDSAKNQTFSLEKRKLTVETYFREKNITLRYPHLPCLWCGPSIKNIYLPLEFCRIQDGQVVKKKLSERQTSAVIAETATTTDIRKQRIMDLLHKIRHNDSKVVQQFGVNIGDRFTEVPARILAPPIMEYFSNVEVKVDRGVWNAEREKFIDGKQCTHWSVLKLDERCPNSDVFRLAEMISEIGRKANMSFAPKFTDLIEMRSNSRRQDIEAKMLPLKNKNVQLLFVIIPNRNEAYPNVKQAAELKCGILTQCIKSFTLARKLNGSTVYNILLKLNSKLNGLNHKVLARCMPPIGKAKIMLVGADVTHPTGTTLEPSAVGVASSHDVNALKYNMCWRIQSPTVEMIIDLKNIMVEQLNYYRKCMNNELPDKILYYRDGVSDGQFAEVLRVELTAIYNACQQMRPGYKPDVTFIVVQKRHNTRLYPGASRVSCGKFNNVMPGTIVDKCIIDPRQYQFFLVSHAAIRGVARPTKYCVIWDDSNIPADQLQALTHYLCHTFTRCNRAVSYVAPTYYAHLAAYRGKVYTQNEQLNMNNLDQEFGRRQIREEISKGHPMFFV